MEEVFLLSYDFQGNMTDWHIVDKIEDVVLRSSITYNIGKIKL